MFGFATLAVALFGCASPGTVPGIPLQNQAGRDTAQQVNQVLNRVTWGLNSSTAQQVQTLGLARYLDGQLHPLATALPAAVQTQVAAVSADPRPLEELIAELEKHRVAVDVIGDEKQKKNAQQAYQQELNLLARNAAARSLLRDLYSPNQLQEQMTWFWLNHFNIHQGKHNLRAMVGDYEENAIRPHALGKFRGLLTAVVQHPAMLRYLDNEHNAVNHLNENFARELMELHTLGVGSGYSQQDVQELARILTGVGTNFTSTTPVIRRDLQAQYVRRGAFEFNPNRHDYGPKRFLGKPASGRGLAELDDALDRLSLDPATALFISRKIAMFLVADEPPQALVDRMARTFLQSDGDIAATLKTLFQSPEFARSLGHSYKDPLHYVVSAVRLAYDDRPILNPGPMLQWINRLGEPLYGRPTPDGYPMVATAWNGSGQMTARFEIAKAIGSGSAGLFRADGPQRQDVAAFPQLSNAVYFQSLQKKLSLPTRQILDQAASPQEWNTLLLSAPELMYR
ncbi:MAG: DUF1800 domain-containing protein [Burkholderiaceae bacterium]